MVTAALAVRDNERELRYELTRDGEVLGFINYRRDPERGRVELIHTDIEPAYEGHGLGSLLVKGALDDLHQRGLRAVPYCPFVRELPPSASRGRMSSEVAGERARRGAAHVYQDDRIQVLWEPKLCIHVQNCVHGLAEVFDAASRPWIHLEAADADRIAETVVTCPTGALHFHRLDGGPQEEGADEIRVEPRPNGPLFLSGRIRIEDADGDLIREDTRVALCRCGGSANKPFCDGTHRTNGFTA